MINSPIHLFINAQDNQSAKTLTTVAFVASVSVGLSAGLKHFSLFGRAKIGDSVAIAPVFAPPKSEKCLERAKKPTETLATQAITTEDIYYSALW